jgi:hypothetical protein
MNKMDRVNDTNIHHGDTKTQRRTEKVLLGCFFIRGSMSLCLSGGLLSLRWMFVSFILLLLPGTGQRSQSLRMTRKPSCPPPWAGWTGFTVFSPLAHVVPPMTRNSFWMAR